MRTVSDVYAQRGGRIFTRDVDRKGYTTVPVSRYSHPPWTIDYRFVLDVLTEFSTYTSLSYVYLPSYCEINEKLLTFPIVHL